MTLNSSSDLSNSSQSESNFSTGEFFECTDIQSNTFMTGFSTLVNVVVILPLNIWILWLMRRTTSASSDFVMVHQSASEVLANASIILFMLGSCLNNKVVILIAIYFCCTLIIGRPLFQTFSCIERYLAVVHPLLYLKYVKASRVKLLLVALVWLIVLIIGWFVMDSYPRVPRFYIGVFAVMIMACWFCSIRILWVLKRPKPGDRAGADQQKRKAFTTVTLIIFTLMFSYGTVSSVIVLRDYLPYQIYCLVLGLSWCMLVPSALVQPYLCLSKIGRLPCSKGQQ